MKLIKLLSLALLTPALAIALAGCQSPGPQNATVIPGSRGNPGDGGLDSGTKLNLPPDTGGGGLGGGLGTGGGGGEKPFTPPNQSGGHPGWAEDTGALKSDTVYFEFDKSTIKSSEQSKLGQVASYLKSNPDKALRVEGNCDERGTEEYNRSLGERRALASREYLINSGIAADRVDTVTRGEDNPAEHGHNEAAWSKNRRDEFIVLTPPGRF